MNHKNLFRFVMLALSWAAVPVCAAAPPSSNFDLSHWKLTLPVDAAGGTTGEAMEIKTPQLTAGYASDYFYSGADNAMVFWCPVIGARTSNATYPRSELRELIDGRNSDVNWSGNGTHVLDARCKVTQLPSTGKVIIGQVHGYDTSPLIKIQVRSGRFEGLVKDHIANDTETKFDLGAFALNSLITYQIKVVDGIAFITVNGTTRSFDFFASDPAWKAIGFYFKAGAYVQDNSGPITEGGRMAFTYLAAAHSTVVGEPPTISTQPLSQTVNEGSPVSLSVVANGSATLSYQWRKNGVNLPNAVAATFSLMSAKTNDAGIYTVAVANSFGAVTSAVATLVVHATNVVVPPTTPPAVAISLSDALDTTGLTWTTNGSPAWFGQTNVNHDGSDSAQSGAIGHSKTTSMQTTVQGPGTVSFWWKVSSQPSDDRLLFYVGSSE
ncbi:MAG TPA: polysaccharide lyase family 7 protein, partial [Candidatus Limnocylindria bacterium]|nr:polysaccharide lyase family 7 protein [Candidatus Limnocylindria bacterium]